MLDTIYKLLLHYARFSTLRKSCVEWLRKWLMSLDLFRNHRILIIMDMWNLLVVGVKTVKCTIVFAGGDHS